MDLTPRPDRVTAKNLAAKNLAAKNLAAEKSVAEKSGRTLAPK
jgi:hypothetical protein